jgi:hypothetical protein
MSALRYARYADSDGRTTGVRLHFDACTREAQGWKEEMHAAARAVMNKTKKPIWINFSGGMEGEIICRAFFDQGIAFSVLTLEYQGGLNARDIQYATMWCRERGIPQEIEKIDIAKFYDESVHTYAQTYPATYPYRYLQIRLMEIIEKRGGYAVISGGNQAYVADPKKKTLTKDDIYLPLSIGTVAPMEWCVANKAQHEPFFHYSTPELCLAYLRVPIVRFALEHPNDAFRHPANSYSLQRIVYQSSWPDMQVRWSDGSENTLSFIRRTRNKLREKLGPDFAQYEMSVSQFERHLRGQDG